MAIGLGSLKKKADAKGKKDSKSDSAQAEAAAVLEKMQAKADNEECPFC